MDHTLEIIMNPEMPKNAMQSALLLIVHYELAELMLGPKISTCRAFTKNLSLARAPARNGHESKAKIHAV